MTMSLKKIFSKFIRETLRSNLNDLSKKVCFPNKTEDLNIHVFNMMRGKNKSKMLAKDISWKCKCRFDENDVIQIKKG